MSHGNFLFSFDSIDDRLDLRRRLHCKPFKWYLEHVYPQLTVPETVTVGALRQGIYCLDTLGHLNEGKVGEWSTSLFCLLCQPTNCLCLLNVPCLRFAIVSVFEGVYQCHDTGGNQEWTITKTGQIRHHDLCLTLVTFAKGSIVIMHTCDESESQRWEMRDSGLIKHSKMNLCLDTRYAHDRGITAEYCNSGLDSQYWQFANKLVWKLEFERITERSTTNTFDTLPNRKWHEVKSATSTRFRRRPKVWWSDWNGVLKWIVSTGYDEELLGMLWMSTNNYKFKLVKLWLQNFHFIWANDLNGFSCIFYEQQQQQYDSYNFDMEIAISSTKQTYKSLDLIRFLHFELPMKLFCFAPNL